MCSACRNEVGKLKAAQAAPKACAACRPVANVDDDDAFGATMGAMGDATVEALLCYPR